jgi:hypothetical protein
MTDQALPNAKPLFPKPTYFGRERRWRLSEIINYERELTELPPLPFDPATERWLTASQLRVRFGDVSDMWIWRRTTPTSRHVKDDAA